MKKVLITGILGVDASILAEKLLQEDEYEVFGLMRRSSNPNFSNIQEIRNNKRLYLTYGDITDRSSIMDLVGNIHPDYLLNFAGFTQVSPSWESPSSVMDVNFGGVLNCLEAIRKLRPSCRFFQAGSSEIFGNCNSFPQNEATKHNPRNFYGISKSAAAHAVRVYRAKYGLFCINGYLWNHECEKRNSQFVFPKICKTIAHIAFCLRYNSHFNVLELGNLDAGRDYCYSADIVDGIWRAINYSEPKDFVFASGEWHTVREILETALTYVNIKFLCTESKTIPYLSVDGRTTLVKYNGEFAREESDIPLIGDASLAKNLLGWHPTVTFPDIVHKIVDYELGKMKI